MENTTQPTELFSKNLEIELHEKHGSTHDTLSSALRVVKAYGYNAYLKFNKGYRVRIWPDSTLNDIKEIEEKTAQNYNLNEKVIELKTEIEKLKADNETKDQLIKEMKVQLTQLGK